MVIKRCVAVLSACLLTLVAWASPSMAATSSWTLSKVHGTIYGSGSYSTLWFQVAQTSLPTNPLITSTTVTVTPYSNGFTTDTVHICYQQPLTTTDYACYPDFNITATTTVTISTFNGQSAKGTVSVRQKLVGGTYPASSLTKDTVTVNYQY